MWTYKSTSKQASQASTLICHEALTVSLAGLCEKWEYELGANVPSLGKGKYFKNKIQRSLAQPFYFANTFDRFKITK